MKCFFTLVFSLTLFQSLTSCSSSSSRARFVSFPEGATVAQRDKDGNVRVLGKTPLEVPVSRLNSQGDMSAIIFSRDGYFDQHFAMVLKGGQTNVDITAKLISRTEDTSTKVVRGQHEKLAQLVAKAHNLITSRRLEEAESILQSVTRDYPSVSVSYDLLGNISYLRKDLGRALSYYEQSLKLNPENPETQRIVNRLRSTN